MRKIFALIVCMTANIAALFAKEAGFETKADGNGVVITKYKGKGGDVVIPAAIGGKAVVGIGDEAFSGNKSLTSVTIPDGVTSIGEAFYGCFRLKAVSVAAANRQYKDIDGVLFTKDGKILVDYPRGGKTTYTIPDGVTSIEAGAFYWFESLASVTIPEGLTSIGYEAFFNCSSLTSVTIPPSVTSIGQGAFDWCTSLKPEIRADIKKRFGGDPFTTRW
jgi:hypothetical protein